MTRTLRSPRLRQKRRRRIMVRGTVFAGIPLFLILGVVFLLRADFLQVREIEVISSGILTDADVRPLAEEKLSGAYLWFIPRTNVLLFPAREIEQALLDTFERIKEVDVSPKGIHGITIKLKEREPVALWCDGEAQCYFVDETGLVYDEAPHFSDSVYLAFSGEIEGEPLGKAVLSFEEFSHVLRVVEGIKETELVPSSVSVLSAREYEVTLTRGETILFTTLESAEETILNLKTVLANAELDLLRPGGLSVSYLDLRYGNKVFYKRKGGDIMEE